MHARLPDLEDVLDRPLMFNAGVFGGHRTVVLEFLARMVSVLDELPPDVGIGGCGLGVRWPRVYSLSCVVGQL